MHHHLELLAIFLIAQLFVLYYIYFTSFYEDAMQFVSSAVSSQASEFGICVRGSMRRLQLQYDMMHLGIACLGFLSIISLALASV